MKKNYLIIMLLACIFPTFANNSVKDTTIILNEKKVIVKDSVDMVRVEVYELTDEGEKSMKQVYVGIFSDNQNFEQYIVKEEIGFSIETLGIPLPFVKKKKTGKGVEPHWAGFAIGFNSISNTSLSRMTTVMGISVIPERSMEWTINPIEKIIPLGRFFGITTGLGVNFKNFNLDNNTHFVKVNNMVVLEDAPAGIDYKKSKFRLAYLNIPLLFEWQPKGKQNFFVAAGVVGGLKLSATHKLKYKDLNSKTQKEKTRGLNTPPLALDCLAKVGYKNFSVYAKYSPFGLFEQGKGPEINAVSAGVMLEF